MSRVSFRKTLGIIQQVDEKQQNPYDNILNFLQNPVQCQNKQNNQLNILQELDNFHKYYSQRHEQYKENYEKLKQQNWDNTAKIIKYEQALQNYQIVNREAKDRISFLENKLQEVQQQYRSQIREIEGVIIERNKEIDELKYELSKFSKIQVPKKKIVKLKDKSIRIDNEQALNLESARSHRQINHLKNQVLQYASELEQLSRQNQNLKKKIKHLEIDRRYEDERLKSATLSLQLDLKIKKQQIQRLNIQLETYEKKFEQMIQTFKKNQLQNNCDKQTIQITDFQRENTIDGRFYDQWKNIDVQQKTSVEEKDTERTHRKLDLDLCEKSQRKTHKRHGSSNLEQNRNIGQKQELNLKIKVFKYNKNRKYI